jgi:hypothetical protein
VDGQAVFPDQISDIAHADSPTLLAVMDDATLRCANRRRGVELDPWLFHNALSMTLSQTVVDSRSVVASLVAWPPLTRGICGLRRPNPLDQLGWALIPHEL